MHSILIADDDEELCKLLQEYLSKQGLQVQTVYSAEAALKRLVPPAHAPDLLVLDVMLPGMDGLAALKRIRELSALPILMLSGRGEPVDRIVGLELGADDYLSKPALPRELLARIQALLRRSRGPEPDADVELGHLQLSPARREAQLNGKPLELTGAEFSVLLELSRHAGNVVSKEQLTQHALNRPLEKYDRAIDVHVSRLRNKLSAIGGAPEIEAVRGAGYILKTGDA
jgi:DNA-binding response OmpR family regulator